MARMITALLFMAVTAGCTTQLKSNHIETRYTPGAGVTYALPRATFDAEVTFLVTRCTGKADNPVLDYEVASGVVRQYMTPDPGEIYRIPYDKLNAPAKSTSVNITLYPTGMIRSINSEVDDRTSQVMSSVASAVINLAKAYATTVVPMATTDTSGACGNKDLARTLAERRALIDEKLPLARATDATLQADQKKANETQTKLNLASALLTEAITAKDAAATTRHREEVTKLQAQLKTEKDSLEKRSVQVPQLQAELARLESALSTRAYLTGWSPAPGALKVDVSVAQEEFIDAYQQATGQKLDLTLTGDTFDAELSVNLDAQYPAVDALSTETEFTGLVYRLPAIGTVSVKKKGSSNVLTRHGSISLPQFGTKSLIWLRNRAFDKNSVVAAFNEDGSLTSLEFRSDARAERAAAGIAETSKSLVDLMQMRADTLKAKVTAADEATKKEQQRQIDELDHQIAMLNYERDRSEAGQPSKDFLDREQERLKKEIEVEKLRQQLEELHRKQT